MISIKLDEGKYTVIQEEGESIKVLRHGEEWRDCVGDNLIYFLVEEIKRLQEVEWMYNDLCK